MFKNTLERTEQIYIFERNDSTISFTNSALEIIIFKDETEMYFDEKLVRDTLIKRINSFDTIYLDTFKPSAEGLKKAIGLHIHLDTIWKKVL